MPNCKGEKTLSLSASANLSGENYAQRRRHHRKSRLGCRNCKLRRVKCDETRPQCKNCVKFLVACNYDPRAPDLHLSPSEHRTGFALKGAMSAAAVNEAMLDMINTSLMAHSPAYVANRGLVHQLDAAEFDRLRRWQTRTVLCMGTPDSSLIYQREVIKIAALYPYLMHAILAITAMHDRFLRAPTDVTSTAEECYHHSCAAALFKERLSSANNSSERCALWTTAVLLSQMSCFSVGTHDPEMSWPLVPGSSSQFEWLNMQEGLRVMWTITAPASPGGLFHELIKLPEHSYLPTKMNIPDIPGIEGLPASLVSLCDLTPLSNSQNNPYHTAVRMLGSIMHLEGTTSNILKLLVFTCAMHPQFKEMLKHRDARAMLLMACWYVKVCETHWWIRNRAMLECSAICIYLERYHYNESKLMDAVVSLKQIHKWLAQRKEMSEE